MESTWLERVEVGESRSVSVERFRHEFFEGWERWNSRFGV